MEMSILSPKKDEYEPTEEDLRDYWSGEGHLVFKVISYDPHCSFEPYEIEQLDYSGCVGGLDETLGIQYSVNEGILDCPKLKIGHTYHLHNITVHWTCGDGWTTDDDVDYYVEDITSYVVLHEWLYAWWWHLIGHRIRNWRNARSKT